MCQFCNFKKSLGGYTGKEYQTRRYSPSVYLKKVDDDYYLVSIGHDVTSIPINYCPKCGRKLVDKIN